MKKKKDTLYSLRGKIRYLEDLIESKDSYIRQQHKREEEYKANLKNKRETVLINMMEKMTMHSECLTRMLSAFANY